MECKFHLTQHYTTTISKDDQSEILRSSIYFSDKSKYFVNDRSSAENYTHV